MYEKYGSIVVKAEPLENAGPKHLRNDELAFDEYIRIGAWTSRFTSGR